ncbi:uncharacterized protein Hap1MRO34_020058 [Clarias gariepinus]|uniref:uncharacterized protein LOC128506963 n=1 Tax=Clarias gariepinus TaxID=13013 RepID=UPI00234D8DDE|nr:uncharacterized protein LOC128506963 [Clarias gariepinus]
MKFFYKLNRLSETALILTRGSEHHQNGRFSISDDTRNKEFSVNISDVGEDDGGVYSCAVSNEETEVIYHSLFTGIQLQVTGSSIIISVLVCVILLLGAGLVLMIYKQRRSKSQGCLDTNQMERLPEIPCSEKTEGPKESVYYSTIPLSSHLSDSLNTVFAPSELPAITSDPPNNVYATAELPTIPSDPPNNVYATAELPTIPSDPPNNVYAPSELPTIPSDPPNNVYATAELPTIPSDPPNNVYATAELPTIPSDPPNNVYATVELHTITSDSANPVYTTVDKKRK